MSEHGESSTTEGLFESLRRRGQRAIRLGDLAGARTHFVAALELAESQGDRQMIDQAFCGLSAVDIELGSGGDCIRRLARILLRQRDPGTSFLAAYNLARCHELLQQLSRARFYARAAHQHAHLAERDDWLAASHNQLGSLLLVDSYFDQAAAHLSRALEHLPASAEVERALVLDNLGYCNLITGETKQGFEYLYRSLRSLIKKKAKRYEIQPRISLCWGLLEHDRPEKALRHGLMALSLSETLGDQEATKQCLFLLGEVSKAQGDIPASLQHFQRLQRTFYPDEPSLPSLLLSIDSLEMVNLKA